MTRWSPLRPAPTSAEAQNIPIGCGPGIGRTLGLIAPEDGDGRTPEVGGHNLRPVDWQLGRIDRIAAETKFSGVVRVECGGDVVFAQAYGMADRAHQVANTVDTQLGIASGTKGFTVLTVVSLIEQGVGLCPVSGWM